MKFMIQSCFDFCKIDKNCNNLYDLYLKNLILTQFKHTIMYFSIIAIIFDQNYLRLINFKICHDQNV